MTVRKLRRSQIVSSFGPGAIIDLVGESFVAEDAGNWRGRQIPITFPRLASYLGVQSLQTPPADGLLPYYRFPRWLFCAGSRRMVYWRFEQERKDTAPMCECCHSRKQLVPMRFVAVCANGHLGDVDWRRWAHSESRKDRNQKQCQTTDLRFKSRSDAGGGLRSLEVACAVCKASRSLDGLTGRSALRQIGMKCPGRQPWQLQQDARDCDEPLVAMQRGASSIYFPTVVSAIDIPPDSAWAVVNDPLTRLLQLSEFRLLVEKPDHRLRNQLLDGLSFDTGLTRVEVERALAIALGREASVTAHGSLDDIFPDEWEALRNPRSGHHPRDYFITRRAVWPEPAGPSKSALVELDSMLEEVILVDRLREVRVLRGFARYTMKRQVSSNLSAHIDYLPSIEVFGEGFFLRFNEDALVKWESRTDIRERCAKITARAQQANAYWLPQATPRYILLHTLAHLLLRNTAFDAGYSTSSLRERLYVTRRSEKPEMAGILIYTAAGDSEGTLGGLTRMGEYERLSHLLFASIAGAQWCSFDPVCSESPGQGPGGLSLAACHACSLVSETSCVATNRILDRRLIVDEEFGFFAQLIRNLGQVPRGGIW
jgi:hypothetical protein